MSIMILVTLVVLALACLVVVFVVGRNKHSG